MTHESNSKGHMHTQVMLQGERDLAPDATQQMPLQVLHQRLPLGLRWHYSSILERVHVGLKGRTRGTQL